MPRAAYSLRISFCMVPVSLEISAPFFLATAAYNASKTKPVELMVMEVETFSRSIPSKRIINGNVIETSESAIVTNSYYETNGEYLIIVKDVESCTITLDGYTTESVKIKVLTKTTILPKYSLIDEQYDEIEIDNGACVELEYVEGNWYIISSDGMKLE